MASGPCLRRCRVVRRYMPTNIKSHRLYVKLCSAIHVSMYYEPCREVSAVNTGVPCPKVPIHRKLGPEHLREDIRGRDRAVSGGLERAPSVLTDQIVAL